MNIAPPRCHGGGAGTCLATVPALAVAFIRRGVPKAKGCQTSILTNGWRRLDTAATKNQSFVARLTRRGVKTDDLGHLKVLEQSDYRSQSALQFSDVGLRVTETLCQILLRQLLRFPRGSQVCIAAGSVFPIFPTFPSAVLRFLDIP